MIQVIAHRGWSEIAPENSHAAFAAAIDAPCAGIECDVRLTADGKVVVCHDATLQRFGGNRRPLARQTLAELRAQVDLPTLEEVLDRYTGVELYIELKPLPQRAASTALIEAVVRLIRDPKRRDRVLLLCFSSAVLTAIHDRLPTVRLVRNTETIPAESLAWLRQHAWCHAIDAAHRAWTPAAVLAAHNLGLVSATYTVDTATDLARVQRLGINRVITNRPRWATSWLAAHPALEVTRRVVRRG